MNSFKENYIKYIKKYKKNYSLQKINNIFDRVYNVIFLDIDKTIIENEKFDDELIFEIYKVLNQGISIYFITGRGRTSSKNIITELFIRMEFLTGINKSNFIEQVFCISNNGINMFYTDKRINDKIFNSKILLLNEEKILKFQKIKVNLIQKSIENIIASNSIKLTKEELLINTKNYSGDLEIRFAFNKSEIINENNLINSLENLLKNNYKNYYLFKGLYKKKIVYEISMIDKNDAINLLISKIGVKKENILKIGDQAEKYGNDFSFLNSLGSFSVDKFDKKNDTLPVLKSNGNVVKGIVATKILLKNIKLYPPICLENINKEYYRNKLAYYENLLDYKNKKITEKYNDILNNSFKIENSNYFSSKIIDKISGGVFISDSEYYLLKNNNRNHILFKIFDCRINGNSIYSLQNERGIILRGSRNYYYGLSFRANKGNISKKLSNNLNENYFEFINVVIREMNNYKSLYNNEYIDRKVLLGIMDNVRNILLVFINAVIQKYINDKNVIIDLENNNIKSMTNIVVKNLKFMYREMFFGNYYNLYNDYLSFLELEINQIFKNLYIKEYNSFDSKYNYKKGYRVWRETDNFLENIMVIENELTQFSIEKRYNFYGMRYGAIELPFIVKMLFDEKYRDNTKNKFYLISSKNNYFLNHSDKKNKYSSYEIQSEKKNVEEFKNNENVLLEDNILTGRTLQVVINNFIDNGIYIDKLIIVRYPTLNRIEHMFIKHGHGAPNVDLFFYKIIGIISPAPYSKFNGVYENRNKNNLYKDELGVFNINREKILRYLYKNKDFAINSEVQYLVEGASSEYIRY